MAALNALSAEDAKRVREFLLASAYDEATVQEIAPTGIPPSLRECDLENYGDRLGAWSSFHCLAKWFFLGHPVERSACREVVPDWFVDLCEIHGLLECEGEWVSPQVLLTPCESVWIASDLHQHRRSGDVSEHILPLNLPARYLCHFLIRRPAGAGLDLCSGNGLHAMMLSGFCQQVTTADLSPRSEMFCQFNAALNGYGRLTSHTGDRFEPLKGQTFDVIVCNPPFVITPEGEEKFHANTMNLDGFCRELIRAVPAHLNEGGICQMVCEWVELPGQSWEERLEEWWDGFDGDVWIIRANTQFPESYVRTRSLDAELTPDEQRARRQAWSAYLEGRQVRAIHGGIITMRRRERGPYWRRIDALEVSVDRAIGEEMAALMTAEDFLLAHGPDEEGLLDWCPRVSPSVLLDQRSSWSGGQWETESSVLSTRHGLTGKLQVDPSILEFLTHCRGETPLRELFAGLASRVGVSPDAMRDEFTQMVRQLVKRGYLSP